MIVFLKYKEAIGMAWSLFIHETFENLKMNFQLYQIVTETFDHPFIFKQTFKNKTFIKDFST
jgi:hypothetical protein